jgi:DHA2 family multidrug resistance protein
VQTAYLMAELVMIPFAAFLAQALSTRWLFGSRPACSPSSLLCGLAWDINSMIAFRACRASPAGHGADGVRHRLRDVLGPSGR